MKDSYVHSRLHVLGALLAFNRLLSKVYLRYLIALTTCCSFVRLGRNGAKYIISL